MLKGYRLFLAIAGVSVAIGLAVALAPAVTYSARLICRPGVPISASTPPCYVPAGSGPDWIAGSLTAVVVCALIVGFILSARALSHHPA
jgi:hypothetical protein